jgi:hypothetical protein
MISEAIQIMSNHGREERPLQTNSSLIEHILYRIYNIYIYIYIYIYIVSALRIVPIDILLTTSQIRSTYTIWLKLSNPLQILQKIFKLSNLNIRYLHLDVLERHEAVELKLACDSKIQKGIKHFKTHSEDITFQNDSEGI